MIKYSVIFSIVYLTGCSLKNTAEPAAVMPLVGSEWTIEDGHSFFIGFKSDGKIIGFSGCNTFAGTYNQDVTTVRIAPERMSNNFCSNTEMSAEEAALFTLKNTRFADASHLELILKDRLGNPIQALRRSDWD